MPTVLSAQQTSRDSVPLQQSAVKVFLDISRRYQDHIKREIPYINYVRDRKEAQVHILLTSQRTGSRGREYTITFLGQQNFNGVNDTLKFVAKNTDSVELIRAGLVKSLKMGLIRYISRTPFAEYISIRYNKKVNPAAVEDKWNNWVFMISTDNDFDIEESKNRIKIGGSLSAYRITPDWKISLYLSSKYYENNFKVNNHTITSISRYQRFRSLLVKSINEHWSVGGYASANSSLYSNTKISISCAPALEYDLFPYSESTRKEFRFLYRLGYTNIYYNQETIYNKVKESLFNESLSASLEIKEKWGSVSATLEGAHYFHDFSKNSLQLSWEFSWRVFEGISFYGDTNISMIHDQLSLPKKDVSEEEILLQRTELATQYQYSFSIGLRFTFGSIYSNVVNPRFGN
ncbi:MAG TPA: hypothetical protein ENH29_11285 [Bacteroidetes bacterium]|nr:hypothetical protein [Bacteroidota bacterium]